MQVISNILLNEFHNSITCKTSIPTHLQSKPLDNYYNILLDQSIDESEEDDDKTVITSNKSSKHECDQATITTAELPDDNISL